MTGEVALVTGAGQRIGAEIAQRLARMGVKVFVHVRHSVADGEAAVRRIIAEGGSAQLVRGDLAVAADIRAIFELIAAQGERLSILVNNASHFEHDWPTRPDFDVLAKSIAIHVTAPVLLFERLMAQADPDRPVTVVNILDQKLANMNPDYYSYTIGKCALAGVTQLWQALDIPKLRVFGVLIGLALRSGRQTEQNFAKAKRANLLRRPATAADICELIEFIVRAKHLPSQTITFDAGASLVRRRRDVAFDPTIG